jgi:hypothetical protein
MSKVAGHFYFWQYETGPHGKTDVGTNLAPGAKRLEREDH